MPIFWEGELVAWVVTVIMEIECGAVCGSAMPAIFNVQRPTDGLLICGERTAVHDTLRKDYLIRIERALRRPHMFTLNRKGALAADISVREEVKRLIREFGVDYFRTASRELIEDARRTQLYRMKERTVPGRFQLPQWLELYFKELPVPAFARNDVIRLIPADVEITAEGRLRVDFEGAGDWGWHSLNCTPVLMYGGLGLTLVVSIAYDGRASHGTLMTVDVNCPPDSIVNPSTYFLPTSNQLAPVQNFCGNFLDAMSRAYFARGYREEILLGMNSVNILGDSMYVPGDPRIPLMGEFSAVAPIHFTGAQGSGARGIADGIELHSFTPETDTGSVETFELGMTELCLGARVAPDSGGFGKYRGGFSLVSTTMVHRADWAVMETWGPNGMRSMLQNRGIFGGYPGNLYYAYVVRNANTRELIDKRMPLPRCEGDPRNPDILKLVKGEASLVKHWWYSKEVLKDYDLFQISFHGNNGGFGDPLDRDLRLIKSDLDLGFSRQEACHKVYRAHARHEDGEGQWVVDEQETASLRAEKRKERLGKGIPFREWWERSREQLLRKELDPLLVEMYANSMKKGPRFADQFRRFWSLPEDFTFEGEEQ